MSDEAVLLSIRRNFSKDESISFLLGKLKTIEFKNGELISENAELRHKMKRDTPVKQKLSKADLLDERIVELNKKTASQAKTIKRLNSDIEIWRNKYLNLFNKTANNNGN